MNLKSILIGFSVFIIVLIGSLIALDTYTLKSIADDTAVVSSTSSSTSSAARSPIHSPTDPVLSSTPATAPSELSQSQQSAPLPVGNSSIDTPRNQPQSNNNSISQAYSDINGSLNSFELGGNQQQIDNNSSENAPENKTDDLPVFIAGDISGRVFTDGGVIVSNISLTATPYDIAAGQSKNAAKALSTQTDELGQYFLNNVPKASYRICTHENEQYTLSCINVLPPQRTADLKINSLSHAITVTGIVSDEAGTPLNNVTVRVNVAGSSSTKSQADGSYELTFKSPNQTIPNIYFSLQNYVKFSQRIFDSTKNKKSTTVINASLVAQNSGFTVTGQIIDEQGEPASGQRIRLSSPSDRNKSTRYAVSDSQGSFTLVGVEPANDYLPSIITSADYRYNPPKNQQAITITDDSPSLNFELEKLFLDYQAMTLFLATQAQQPLSGLTLNLNYRGKLIERAITNASGGAAFTKVPNGNLTLSVTSLNLRVSGLTREKHNGVTILADKGENEASITVLGENGQSVVCRRATISWSQVQNDLRVNASRSVQSDQSGIIYATDFGHGEHALSLSQCDGHKSYNGKLNIGTETNFSVTLSPL